MTRQTKSLSVITTNLLRDATPKLTGNAQNNWIPTIGAPFPTVDGSPEAPSARAQNKGIQRVQNFYKFPQVLHITNNVDYLKALNDGSSTQAPAGFIQTAIARGIIAAKRTK